MRRFIASFCVLFALCIAVFFTLLVSFNTRGQVKNQEEVNEPRSVDFSRFPIGDFVAQEINASARDERRAKSQKFNNRFSIPISESSLQIFTTLDWDVGLTAFPSERSDAVVIGHILDGKAYVSEDKTTIYSEFSFRVQAVLKPNQTITLTPGQIVAIEREGGRLRLPSRKIVTSWINHQNMPRVGGKYVLFLTHQLPRGGTDTNGFYILTGYEFQNGKIDLLDDTLPSHPISSNRGKDEATFLNDLVTSLSRREKSN